LPWAATITTVYFFGWLLLLGGASEVFTGFLARVWSGMFLDIIIGAISMMMGLTFIALPDIGAALLTILLASFFLTVGAFRLYVAYVVRFPGWSLAILSGVLLVVLGVVVATQWPVSSMWVVGAFVGLELICRGIEWIAFALTLHHFLEPSRASTRLAV
jgi:uncharacterized membrane protein HdeD (DUF308 family)